MTSFIGLPVDFISELIPLQLVLPLFMAVLCFLVKSPNINRWLSVCSAFIHLVLTILLVVFVVSQGGSPIEYALGGWSTPLGISLRVNTLSAILLLMCAVISLAITIYSGHYFYEKATALRFWPLWWLLNTALYGIFIAGDLFNLYVLIELLGLSSVSLIAISQTQKAFKAAYQYLMVGLFGSLLFLLGISLIYRHYGVLDMQLLSESVQGNLLTKIALAFITLGLLLKTALYPLHFWLPDAHSSAPAPVSAALSALVLKGTFYILFTLWFSVLTPATTLLGATVIGAFGAAAILWGSIKAYTTENLKLVVAYSTVAQIGYLFMLFPLMYTNPTKTFGAVAYFIVAHACAKAAMFMAAGNIQQIAGHDEIKRMSGIASHMPISIFVFAIAGVSLMGLPPSGGFIAKWLMFNSALESGQWWWVIFIVGGGLLSAGYLFRVLNLAFTTPIIEQQTQISKSAEIGLASASLLAVITILIGLNAMWILDIVDLGLSTATFKGSN
jgi:formate hydrogenlyase subunit 3/multisubunit Na+/H+ antiporter MnhD subunit